MKINLLQEEIDQLKNIKVKTEKLALDLGEVSIQKARLEILEGALKEDLKQIMLEEQEISDNLVKKYGAVSINIEDGTALKIT